MAKNKKIKSKVKARNNRGKINWRILITSLAIVYLVAFIGSIFTMSAVNSSWYNLIKPSITPPNYVFPIVWSILFFLIALSLYFNWITADKKEKSNIILVYGINFFLNILWSVLYFGMKNPLIAFFDIIAMLVSIIAMISVSNKISKKAAYLLIPYLGWVCFATILNLLTIIRY
jgi:translocator protein